MGVGRSVFQTASLGKAYAVFPSVIPTQAGIHICSHAGSDKNQETEYRLRIPACVGMTAVRLFGFMVILNQMPSETADSNVRPT
ncbi:hypothetical protein EPM78_09455 [Neisseria gonorrhoeae]|uniref:Uncharacterized protein n=2 Tax=Neisseria gonorrhoeae TaxID=485 RepID=A0A0H4IS51_NEIG1|nr:hypothetical protein NGO_08040 [Neisseria gonorrhoeae FA 1090]ANJ50555.1 hypothetical protein A9Y60_08185 [Neisseria gonorrhoeae]EEH62689.1 predicted protein [Neisseria gonorrhoeae 1291]EEZ44208.1 predicted protein [Neisseria gonorrhoeae 35/02]EEZ50764.1 predicted protein [Neisseria gonorrhoeae PID18]EEZ53093.1 predicted protein [Neisseria gonorrhoeae PID1]EEZ55429.1 predicted protein [Neisseria gonorrhoeae PID332]EEZ57529.1 predicted protein [Neisseria gonorrhoeae SK-92-679]EEZ59856.1 p